MTHACEDCGETLEPGTQWAIHVPFLRFRYVSCGACQESTERAFLRYERDWPWSCEE